MNQLKIMQNDASDTGKLMISVTSSLNNFPISGATVNISLTGGDGQILEQLNTDTSGQTEEITLGTPPLEYSMNPGEPRPYSEFSITVTAPGYEPQTVDGTEVLPEATALQNIRLRPLDEGEAPTIMIPDHTLYGEYPPKIAEAEVKPISDSGSIVLSRVVVPEIIVVHDGTINDSSAPNYYVPYKDYIKNVASSEIYANWPESTIVANVLAIMSFTMNRVYTEWYRNKGFDFTITSSTAYDHKWIYGRNIFESISVVVDDIFTNYLSRPDVKQPILTQYCDGKRVSCPGWMTQWGSKSLGDQGYSPIEILRYYYGQDMYINSAEQISGIPASWPGENLTIGSTGPKVRQMQDQLNTIASIYTAIPSLTPDGIYGEATKNSVETFQSVFGLPQTGVVDFRTWYKISEIYVGVSRIAELN